MLGIYTGLETSKMEVIEFVARRKTPSDRNEKPPVLSEESKKSLC